MSTAKCLQHSGFRFWCRACRKALREPVRPAAPAASRPQPGSRARRRPDDSGATPEVEFDPTMLAAAGGADADVDCGSDRSAGHGLDGGAEVTTAGGGWSGGGGGWSGGGGGGGDSGGGGGGGGWSSGGDSGGGGGGGGWSSGGDSGGGGGGGDAGCI